MSTTPLPSAGSPSSPSSSSVVVVGAGAIGTCTAYYLAKRGARVTVVEQKSVACAASGKAGGFLALDWCDGGPLGPLARASFLLHRQLAQDEIDGASCYGYRPLETLSVAIHEPVGRNVVALLSPRARSRSSLPPWIDCSGVLSSSSIGSLSTTAQVHPQLFTRAVMAAATERWGAHLHIGKFETVQFHGTDPPSVSSAIVDGAPISADAVVLAMGPWSSRNEILSNLTSISGLKAHSIVLQPREPHAISPHALFLQYRTREGRSMEPEVYPRPSGEVYVCGMSENVPVPDDPDDILPRQDSIETLRQVAGNLSSKLQDAPLVQQQACFLPCSQDGLPLIGKLPGSQGLYVATGHSCWGILNAPASGAALAELILDGHSKLVDLSPFDPARFL